MKDGKDRSRGLDASGFSLIEVLIAAALLATVLVSLAELFLSATRTVLLSRDTTFAAILAQRKLEELRGLTWGFDADGLPLADTDTDTSLPDSPAEGGTGLRVSPAGTLLRNTAGYVDYVDAAGHKLGGGATPREGTAYVRRWSVAPSPLDPADTLALEVLVLPVRHASVDRSPSVVLPAEAWLATTRTRSGR